jgi:predicted transcriptional regulator of viral defense system
MTPENCPVDEFLVASQLTDDAIISHHAALSLLGYAYSGWNLVTYFTADKNIRSMRFRNIDYKPVAHPIELRITKQLDWGITTQDRLGINIRVTNLERTLVDVLHRPELAGGFEEIWRSLEAAPYFKLDKVIDYALLLNSPGTNARLGFFLEQHKDNFSVKDSHLDALRQHKPSLPRKMTNTQNGGVLVPQWNLKVPAEVLNRSWEEF